MLRVIKVTFIKRFSKTSLLQVKKNWLMIFMMLFKIFNQNFNKIEEKSFFTCKPKKLNNKNKHIIIKIF